MLEFAMAEGENAGCDHPCFLEFREADFFLKFQERWIWSQNQRLSVVCGDGAVTKGWEIMKMDIVSEKLGCRKG